MYDLPEIPEPVEKLDRLVRKERDAQIQRRYHMVLLMNTGKAESRSGAGRHLEVHRNTIADWPDLYEEGGLEKPREIGEPGPAPSQQSIPSDVMEKLKERFSVPVNFGSYKQIHQWPAEEHGVELCCSTVHGIVRYDLEAKPKSPRPSHPKKRAGANRLSEGASRPAFGRFGGGESASEPVL